MKLIKILSLILGISTLAACSEGGDLSSNESSQVTSSSSESSTAENSSLPEISEIITSEPEMITYPKMTIKLSPENEEIKKTLEEFGRLYAAYCGMDMYQNYLFEKNADGFPDENDDGVWYTRVSKGGITTYSEMTEKLHSILTDNGIEETREYIADWFRAGDDDALYVRRQGAGGFLGESYTRINSISYPDNDTILLDMSTVGEAEEWGYAEDLVEDFQITLKRTGEGLRIDSFGGDTHHFLSLTMNLLQYKNVFMLLDNETEFEASLAAEDAENGWQRPLNKTEIALKLLEDYGHFYLDMTPTYEPERLMDKSHKITVEKLGVDGNPYTRDYYKATGLPANTLGELTTTLDGLVTENLKQDFLKMTDTNFLTVAENGDLYMSTDPYGRGLGVGMDALYLDSIEYPDNNTILITVTSYGSGELWGRTQDILDTASAKLVKTENGWRIDECDVSITDFFGFYNELIIDFVP